MRAAPALIDELRDSDRVDNRGLGAEAEPLGAAIATGRPRRWGRQATLAAGTLGALGGFVALTRTIGGKRGNALDRRVVRAMGRTRTPVGSALVRSVTFFGSAPGATVISIAAVSIVRRRPLLAWQVVVGAVGATSAELGWKRIFRRKRPTILAPLERVQSSSFPSGHSMASASIYLTLAFVASRSRRFRGHLAALLGGAGALAASVGASRVYLGVHWPTDVLGGLALGTAWACFTEAAFDLSGRDGDPREACV